MFGFPPPPRLNVYVHMIFSYPQYDNITELAVRVVRQMEYLVQECELAAEVGTIAHTHTHAKSDAITHLHTAPHNASGRFHLNISMAALLFYCTTRGSGCGEGEMIPSNKALPACLSSNVLKCLSDLSR